MLRDVLEHLMSVVSQAASVHAMLLVALEDSRDDVGIGKSSASVSSSSSRSDDGGADSAVAEGGGGAVSAAGRSSTSGREPHGGGSGGNSGGRAATASSILQRNLQREGCERDSREALEHMWRIAQRHIGRMFDIRQKELASQPLHQQKALWDMVSQFVTRAQKKCGRRGDTLLNTLMAQVMGCVRFYLFGCALVDWW